MMVKFMAVSGASALVALLYAGVGLLIGADSGATWLVAGLAFSVTAQNAMRGRRD